MVSINGQDTVLLGDSDCNESIQSFNGEEWVKTELKGTIPSPRTVSQAARFKNQVFKTRFVRNIFSVTFLRSYHNVQHFSRS